MEPDVLIIIRLIIYAIAGFIAAVVAKGNLFSSWRAFVVFCLCMFAAHGIYAMIYLYCTGV